MRGSIVKRQGKGRRRGKPVDLYYVVYQVGKRQKWEAVPVEACMSKRNTLTIEADEGYSVKLVTRRRVLIESPTGEHYQVLRLFQYRTGSERCTIG